MSELTIMEVHIYQDDPVKVVLRVENTYMPDPGDILDLEYTKGILTPFKVTKILLRDPQEVEAIEIRMTKWDRLKCWFQRCWQAFVHPLRVLSKF